MIFQAIAAQGEPERAPSSYRHKHCDLPLRAIVLVRSEVPLCRVPAASRISRRQYYFTSAGRTSSESSCRAQKKRPIPQYNPQDQISDEHSPHVLYLQADIVLLREGIRVGEGSRSTHNTNLSIPRRRLYNFTEVGALRETFGEGSNQP